MRSASVERLLDGSPMQQLVTTTRPSDRKFGFTFGAAFLVLCVFGVFASWGLFACISCALASIVLLVAAAVVPHLLAPLNAAWFLLGELLGRIVSPIALGIMFFLLLTPVAVVTRMLGRDELRLKRPALRTYWIARQAPVLEPDSFKQQF